MGVTLRPYQSDGIAKIRQAFAAGAKAPLYVLPTGGGKTVLFSAIAESSQRRAKRVLILCHRVELIDQIVSSLKEFDVRPDVIAAGYSRGTGNKASVNRPVTVASVQTLVRRLDDYPAPTLIIVDECHHVSTGGQWSAILRKYGTARVLGVTATPLRLDGRGLGSHFDLLIVGPSIQELIDGGYLVPSRVFAPPTVDTSGLHMRMGDFKTNEAEALVDTPSIMGDALSHYRKHADNRPALAFCTSVAHAHHVADRFREEGIDALALDGGTDRNIRRMAVNDFRQGKIRVLASCDLFSEGFDVPGVHVGIMLRPTASEGLHRQQIGRVLRPCAAKSHAIIMDHVGNCQRHGLPADPREWTLDQDSPRAKRKPVPSIRVCPKCFAASHARATECVECGTKFPVKPRTEIDTREGDLVELTAEEIARKRERREQGRSRTLAELQAFARIKGYSPEWAQRVFKARMSKRKESA